MRTSSILLFLAAFVNPRTFIVETDGEIGKDEPNMKEAGADYADDDTGEYRSDEKYEDTDEDQDDGLTDSQRLTKMLEGDDYALKKKKSVRRDSKSRKSQ